MRRAIVRFHEGMALKLATVLLGVAVALVLFRFVISAAFGIQAYVRYYLPLPVMAAAIVFLLDLKKYGVRASKFTWVECATGFFLVLSSIYWVQIYFTSRDLFLGLFTKSFSTQFVLIFSMLLLRTAIRVEDIYHLIRILSYGIIWISAGFFIVLPFFYYANDIVNFILPFPEQMALGSVFSSMRRAGFLIRLEPSACALLAATILLIFEIFSLKLNELPKSKVLVVTALVGIIGTIFSTSFTAIAGFVVLIFMAYYFSKKEKKISFSYLGVITLILVVFLVGATQVRTGIQLFTRLLEYIASPGVLLEGYRPDFGCSVQTLIWNLDPIFLKRVPCTFREWHVLARVANHGLLPNLGFLFWLFLPIYFLFQIKRFDGVFRGLVFFCFAFTFCAIHYSGAEAWGNNYLFLLAMVGVVKFYFLQRIPNKFHS